MSDLGNEKEKTTTEVFYTLKSVLKCIKSKNSLNIKRRFEKRKEDVASLSFIQNFLPQVGKAVPSPSLPLSSTAWMRAGWYSVLHVLASRLQTSLAGAARAAVNFAIANFDKVDARKVMEELESAPPLPGFKPQLGKMREVRLYLYAGYALKQLKKRLREALGVDKVSHGFAVAFAAAAYLMYARRESLHPVLADMLRQVYLAARGEPRGDRKRRALSELYLRMEAVRRLERAEGKELVPLWTAVIREVEAAEDPLPVLERYLGGKLPRVVVVDDPYRQMWAKLVADSGGDPQRFRQLFWLRKEGIRGAARTKAQREAVDAVAGLVDSRPDMALEYAKAIAEGRYVKLEREVDVEEVRRRAEEWLAAFRNIFKAAYLEAVDRRVELHQAVVDRASEALRRFRAWHRRYAKYLDPELAKRLAPVAEAAELHALYVKIWRTGSKLPADYYAAVNGGDLVNRFLGVAQEISDAVVRLLIQEGVFQNPKRE